MGSQAQSRIEPMRVLDLPQVLRVERRCFTTPWSYQAFLGELVDNDNAYYLVAKDEGTIQGYIGVWIIVDEGHITNVAVEPKYQGKGIGRKLIETITELAFAKGVRRLTLEVRISNKIAQGLYYKLGFVNAGVRPGYYRDNNEDALIMWKDLSKDDQEKKRISVGD